MYRKCPVNFLANGFFINLLFFLIDIIEYKIPLNFCRFPIEAEIHWKRLNKFVLQFDSIDNHLPVKYPKNTDFTGVKNEATWWKNWWWNFVKSHGFFGSHYLIHNVNFHRVGLFIQVVTFLPCCHSFFFLFWIIEKCVLKTIWNN